MPEELIMRGQTVSGTTETLNFGGRTPGYGYHLTKFQIYPSGAVGGTTFDLIGAITADDSAVDPADPNFNSAGLIATSLFFAKDAATSSGGVTQETVINDLFVITQDLILMVSDVGGAGNPVNWQCKFKKVKLSASAEAVANFNQFTIYDG